MKLKKFIDDLKSSFGQKGLKGKVASILYKEDAKILAQLKAHSAVDSGTFRDNWTVVRPKINVSGTLAGIRIANDTPFYGQFVAGGADPMAAPWYYPHRDSKSGRFKKGTGKLKMANGKIWAGGLNPGHANTVGGPIAIVLSKYTDEFTQELSDKVVKGFV